MYQLPYEIIKKIILNISSCSTKDSSNVCKIWRTIFEDKFLTISDKKIIVNDTFMFNKILDNFYKEEIMRPKGKNEHLSSRHYPITEYFSIEIISNPKCLTLIALFEIAIDFITLNRYNILDMLCATNNTTAIYFYTKWSYGKLKSGYYDKLLSICLINHLFELVNFFLKR